MKWWRTLRRATDREQVDRDARRLDAIAESLNGLSGQVTNAARALETAIRELQVVQTQTARLTALRAGDADAAARLDQLERLLEPERIAAHVRDVVAAAPLLLVPIPHLELHGVLPADVYGALADAVPPEIFFDADAGRPELPLPLTLAPVHTIAAWAFVAHLTRTVLGPAVAARFAEQPATGVTAGGPIKTSRGRLVRHKGGDVVPAGRRRTTHAITLVLPLIGSGEDHMQLVLRLYPETGRDTPTRTLPACANLMVAFASLAGDLEWQAASGDLGPRPVGHITYESHITASGE